MNCPKCDGTATHRVLNMSKEIVGLICRDCMICYRVIPEPPAPARPAPAEAVRPFIVPEDVREKLYAGALDQMYRMHSDGWCPVVLAFVKPGASDACALRFPAAVTPAQVHDLLAAALPSLREGGGQ